MKTVSIYHIISYQMNQSGQLMIVGKNIDGDTQFRNVNPDTRPIRLFEVNHERYTPHMNEAMSTT